ncbi:MAG: EAL domain-containing protein [Methylotenera sp.]|nr:EAL domain-containing protein [Methylotenera sp.]
MTKHQQQQASLALLKEQFNASLQLDLDDFALEANAQHEYVSRFVGINLRSSFQPIYDIEKGDLHGFEAFLQASLGDVQETSSDFAYSYAKATGKLVKFDRVLRTLHLLNYKQIFQEKGFLFLSVHPDLLISVNEHGKVFERILHQYSLPTERVVIQIRDYSATDQIENLVTYERQLAAAIDNYHDRGYKIAIDYFGNKHSLVSRLWKLSPDYIKFDPNLIKEAEAQPRLSLTLKSLSNLIKDLGATPVMTNVATQAQLDIALQAGVSFVQGDYLGKSNSASQLHASELIQRRFLAT